MKFVLFFVLFLFVAVAGGLEDDVIFVNGFEEPEVVCTEDVFPPGYIPVRRDYVDFNDTFLFGQSTHTSFELSMSIGTFVILEPFGWPDEDWSRRIVMEDAPTQRFIGQSTISVSKCPGDFTEAAACSWVVNRTSTLWFSTREVPLFPHACKLEPGVDYYINYILTPEPYGQIASCHNTDYSVCTFFYSESGSL